MNIAFLANNMPALFSDNAGLEEEGWVGGIMRNPGFSIPLIGGQVHILFKSG